MMMPSLPTAHLVMIQTDFTFGFFKDGFDGPTHPTDPHELVQWAVDGSIGVKVFDHGRIIQVATNDQPEFWTRQVAARFSHAQKCRITNDGTLTAFLDHSSDPILLGDLLHQLLDWKWTFAGLAQTQAGGMAPVTFPFWNMNFGWDAPDQGVFLDGGEIAFIQRSHSVPKCGRVPIQGVCRHPGKGQIAAFDRILHQYQPNFRLRFVQQVSRYATRPSSFVAWLCASLCAASAGKPFIRHEQLPLHQTVPFATGIPQIHTNLPVRDLAYRSTILCRHSHRFTALLDCARFVDQHNSVLFSQAFTNQSLMDHDRWLRFPLALSHKILQAAHFLTQAQCHLFNVLARGIAEQAVHINKTAFHLLHSLKGNSKQLHI